MGPPASWGDIDSPVKPANDAKGVGTAARTIPSLRPFDAAQDKLQPESRAGRRLEFRLSLE